MGHISNFEILNCDHFFHATKKNEKCKIPKCFFSMGSLGRFFWCMDFFKFRIFLRMDFFNPKIFFGAWKKSILGFFSPKNGTHHITSYDAI